MAAPCKSRVKFQAPNTGLYWVFTAAMKRVITDDVVAQEFAAGRQARADHLRGAFQLRFERAEGFDRGERSARRVLKNAHAGSETRRGPARCQGTL